MSVVVECDCGEREILKGLDLTGVSVTACECGANLTAGVREGPVAELPLHEDERRRVILSIGWTCARGRVRWRTTDTGLGSVAGQRLLSDDRLYSLGRTRVNYGALDIEE